MRIPAPPKAPRAEVKVQVLRFPKFLPPTPHLNSSAHSHLHTQSSCRRRSKFQRGHLQRVPPLTRSSNPVILHPHPSARPWENDPVPDAFQIAKRNRMSYWPVKFSERTRTRRDAERVRQAQAQAPAHWAGHSLRSPVAWLVASQLRAS